MSSNLTKITGTETQASDGSPLDALIDFYRSFNARDLDGLAANWADGDTPSMDNPIGGIRRGWPAIREGYSKLFDGPANVQVAFHDFTSQGGGDWHLFVGLERGVCKTPMVNLDLRIRMTLWFIKTNGVWRQLHHHGSIDEPELLADYQRAIFGAPLEEKEHTDSQPQMRAGVSSARPRSSGEAAIVSQEKLPNVLGKTLTVQITDLPPGGRVPEIIMAEPISTMCCRVSSACSSPAVPSWTICPARRSSSPQPRCISAPRTLAAPNRPKSC